MRTEHIAETPRGWRVRMKVPGPWSSHLVAIAFPPGRRKKGSGRVVEILHPKDEATNPACSISKANPSELLIFGNPSKLAVQRAARERAAKIRGARLNSGHKKDCPCFACKHQRAIAKADRKMPKPMREVMRSRNPKGLLPNAPPWPAVWYEVKLSSGVPLRFRTLEQAKKAIKPEFHGEIKRVTNPNPQRATPRRRRKDRNPSETEQAVRLFETFHGKDASAIAEKHVSAAMRKDYTALGNLVYLKVRTPLGETAKFDFDGDGVMLASSPDGKQLYCIGGRQNLLSLLDEDSQQKDFIDLGECLEVAYLARKIHSNYEPIEWFHKFGEKSGVLPQLMFDKLKKQIFFVGGEYFIDPKVDVSPGIEN
jgi:hypothetical protein